MELQTLLLKEAHVLYFREFIQQLVQKFKPLQIFNFSKTCSVQDDHSCFKEGTVTFHLSYCLLLVTEYSTQICYEAQDFANSHYQQGVITIICHSKKSIFESISNNSRFFITVYISGKMIYSRDGLFQTESTPAFIPTKAALKAKKHYDHHLPLAEGFLMGASECLNGDRYSTCVFMLHQVVEQICITLIRVHIAYRAEFHNLHRLLRLCSCFSDKPYKLFLSTPEDERLFNILSKSYSSARYNDNFSVSQEDTQHLYKKVLAFVTLAKRMCEEKIELQEQEATRYNELIKIESELSFGS